MQACRTASAYPEISQVALHGVLLVAEAGFIYRQVITQVFQLHLMRNERKAGHSTITGFFGARRGSHLQESFALLLHLLRHILWLA